MTIITIIGGISLGIISGGWCGLLFANLFEDTSKKTKRNIIITSVILLSAICTLRLGTNKNSQKSQPHCCCECCIKN